MFAKKLKLLNLKGGLRLKIIAWSFVPTSIILLLVALVMFYAYQQVTEMLVVERNQELTRLSANELGTAIAEYSRVLDRVGNQIDFSNAKSLNDSLQQAKNNLAVFDGGVVVLNSSGEVVTAYPQRPEIVGQNWASRPYVTPIIGSFILRPTISDLVADGANDAEVIVFTMPVAGNQQELKGILLGMFQVGPEVSNSFYGTIIKLNIKANSNVYLVDPSSRVIFHSNSQYNRNDFSTQEIVDVALNSNAVSGSIFSTDMTGNSIVASFGHVTGTSWHLINEENWNELVKGGQYYQRFLLVLLALGGIIPVVVVAIGVRYIIQPITDLTAAAREVAAGNFGQIITTSTGDELDELAQQFNRMSANLQELYATLEYRVAARTQELATLNTIATTINNTPSLDQLVQHVLDQTLVAMRLEKGLVVVLDGSAKTVISKAHQGISNAIMKLLPQLQFAETIVGHLWENSSSTLNSDDIVITLLQDYPDSVLKTLLIQENFHLVVSVPLMEKGELLGVMSLGCLTPRQFTAEETSLLASIGQQLGIAIKNAQLHEQDKIRLMTIEQELKIAQDVQRSLLSPAIPDWPLEVICYTMAAREVGGDFYTYHKLGDNHYVIAVGDVSGKGVPAALLMAISLAAFQSDFNRAAHPTEFLPYLNETIKSYTGVTRQNCAMVYIEIEGQTLRAANAGCISPIIKRHNGQVEWLDVFGLPLGVNLGNNELFGYQEITTTLCHGDLIVLTSDGSIEATDSQKQLFGFERFEQAMIVGPSDSAASLQAYLQLEISAFIGDADPHDDLTLVVIRV
jgi:serine phosphatase RsbU (regulator of sigma subunit)/HAMP domain-containing protein